MRRLLHVSLAIVLILLSAGFSPVTAAAEDSFPLDLANVPLPLQELPESGYQVLSGGYLNQTETLTLIAEPRNADASDADLGGFAIERAYVLDMILPVDRADENADVLAVLQTGVYETTDAEVLATWMAENQNSRFVSPAEPAVPGATTVSLTGLQGEQIRTVIADGDVVIEVVSLDTTGKPDATQHALIVEATLARLAAERDAAGQGVSTMALTLAESDAVVPYSHTQQSGVHGIYRLRDGQLQEAVGEMIPHQSVQMQPGLESIYYSSAAASTRNSISVVNVMIARFENESEAEAFLETVGQIGQDEGFVDPYFAIAEGSEWVALDNPTTYRVTGTFKGDPYSGYVEARVEGSSVFLVGYRVIGAAAPAEATTTALADVQQACLSGGVCEPVDLDSLVVPPSATPMAEGVLGSAEYGWRLEPLGDEFTVTEQFNESGYDRIMLQNGTSQFELESVVNHHGDPVQCVLDQKNVLQEFEEHSYIRVYQDPDGESSGGTEAGHAWIVYQVEPLENERADQEYVIRIDCYQLPGDAANLVVSHTAPIAGWATERTKGDTLRDALVLPESTASHGKLLALTHVRRTMMIDVIWISPAA